MINVQSLRPLVKLCMYGGIMLFVYNSHARLIIFYIEIGGFQSIYLLVTLQQNEIGYFE